jgi:hypothetical protein
MTKRLRWAASVDGAVARKCEKDEMRLSFVETIRRRKNGTFIDI